MMISKISKFFLGFSVLAALSLSPTLGNANPTIAAQPCDASYWNTLSERAWLEAEREIMQNQNLIFKPDSVFEYTCFDRILAHTATNAGRIFSHTNYFGTTIIEENATLGLRNSLGTAVYDALKVYISSNFSHTFLGGRANDMPANTPDTTMALGASATNYTSLFAGGYGTCAIMNDIWQTSKCANFIDNAAFDDMDGFYPFDAITNPDGTTVEGYRDQNRETRERPIACGGDTYTGWTAPITAINNFQDTSFRTPLSAVYTDVYDRTRPGNCGDPIFTGVTVFSTAFPAPNGARDGVCSNPACSYTATSATAGTCS